MYFIYINFTLLAPNCTVPLPNGHVTLNDGSQVPDVVPAGSEITFICNKGFTLYGHSNFTCDASGKLNDTAPNCTGMNKHSK